MQIITTVYVSHLEPVNETNTEATLDAMKMEDLSRIIERKLKELPDGDRELVSVHTGRAD